jgi:hypothetical protein
MTMTKKKVKGCSTCPFGGWVSDTMAARCSAADRSINTDSDDGGYGWGPQIPSRPPKWCPLPIVVERQ